MTTTVASVTTREIQEIDSPFNDMFMKVDIPSAYRVDAKSFIERPFYVDQIAFPDTAPIYSYLTNSVRFLPGDIARSNPSVLNMFKMAAYGRPDLIINVSMAGTITHAGCVLVGVLPPMPAYPIANGYRLINTILSGPHAFLHANEATSVAIPVPWFCNTDLATTDMDQTAGYDTTLDITVTNGNYATLVYLVLNPLLPSTGSTKTLQIIVEACFKNFDLAVPTPRYVSWLAQSGSMFNPTYEDFDALAKAHGIVDWVNLSPKRKKTLYQRIMRYAPYITGVTTLFGLMVRIAFSLLTGEDPVPIDFTPTVPNQFLPQTGLLDSVRGVGTGLIDSAFKGMKTVASDALDAGRALVRSYTGLHNPNIPNVHHRVITTSTNFVNNVDVPQFFEKLDPYAAYDRLVKEPIFGSSLDEMAISNIITKKQYLGTFSVTPTDLVGKMKWARPISPFQGGNGTTEPDGSLQCTNNIELLHTFSRAWRGGLKLTIQSVMNNKQQCKLKVVKMYNPSIRVASAYPDYKTVVNAPTHLLEFTQGGQEHEVELPYLCRNDLTPCATNMDTEALFHGIYYIYVAQPLVISDSSPQNISFNIYMSGESDLTFYGYTTAITNNSFYGIMPPVPSSVPPVLTNVALTRLTPRIDFYSNANDIDEWILHRYLKVCPEKDRFKWTPAQLAGYATMQKNMMSQAAAAHATWKKVREELGGPKKLAELSKRWEYDQDFKCIVLDVGRTRAFDVMKIKKVFEVKEEPFFVAQSGTVKVMNEPQKQSHTTRVESKTPNLTHMTRLMPTLDVRPLIRRMYKSQAYVTGLQASQTSNVSIPLASFIGEDPAQSNYTPIETISRMYYGKTVGFKFRALVTLVNIRQEEVKDIDVLSLRMYYIPQNINALTTNKTVAGAGVNLNAFSSPFNPTDGVPLPYQLIGKESTTTHHVYEFSVPDTSFYKFMGSPNKFYNFGVNPPSLSQADFGSIVLQFTNLARDQNMEFSLELFVGLTDESRLGYHTMAPPFKVFKNTAAYAGTNLDPNAPATNIKNPFLYRG